MIKNLADIRCTQTWDNETGTRAVTSEWIGPNHALVAISGHLIRDEAVDWSILPYRLIFAEYDTYTDTFYAIRSDGGARAYLRLVLARTNQVTRLVTRYFWRALFRAGMLNAPAYRYPRLRDIRFPSRHRSRAQR